MKYSDLLADWLLELGYTHCFFVAGGNIMHLLESCSHRLTCIPVVHEVAAGIAAEYFNEVSPNGRAFALVTAGPGLTNVITAMAGAFLESRELLVIGGQVKVSDLARGQIRQRGIQEIDGVSIARPVAVTSALIEKTVDHAEFVRLAESGSHGRKGPVFLEVPLDIQGAKVDADALRVAPKDAEAGIPPVPESILEQIASRLRKAERPVILIGGGVSRATSERVLDRLAGLGVPLMATWNGIDRLPEDHPLFFGRPNTWGQRAANILMQQSDLLLALGTRLGLQQTGFNWQQFIPIGEVIQVECVPV
jgi:acetolactate synthase-1/2/3 large subunit